MDENIPGQLFDLGLGKGSLKNDIKSTTPPQKKQIDRLCFIKIKIIISSKGIDKTIKRQAKNQKKIIVKHIPNKFYQEYIKNSCVNSNKTYNLSFLKSGQNILTQYSPKKIYEWKIAHEKKMLNIISHKGNVN